MIDHLLNDPFKNRGESYKAIQIIHRTFSQKLKNYDHVTSLVNRVIGSNVSIETMIKFVEQIVTYPALYGYEAVENYTNFLDEIRQHSVDTKSPTVILTPVMNKCFFCPLGKQLIIKKVKFTKEPLLFGISCIGKTL
jgi:hypothetical protein